MRAHGLHSFSKIPSTVEVVMKEKPKDRGSSSSMRFEERIAENILEPRLGARHIS